MWSKICAMIVEWVKVVGALLAFLAGLYQYTRAQKWKRGEFVAKQIKAFEADKKIQAALTMLDWNAREVSFPSETTEKPLLLVVDQRLLCSALLPHESAQGYTAHEAMIRDCFDSLLDALVRFWNFVEADLISVDELRPYLIYWIRLMAGQMADWHTPAFYALLLYYIKHYGFDGAAQLIEGFGYSASVSDEVLQQAIADTLAHRQPLDSSGGSVWRQG